MVIIYSGEIADGILNPNGYVRSNILQASLGPVELWYLYSKMFAITFEIFMAGE